MQVIPASAMCWTAALRSQYTDMGFRRQKHICSPARAPNLICSAQMAAATSMPQLEERNGFSLDIDAVDTCGARHPLTFRSQATGGRDRVWQLEGLREVQAKYGIALGNILVVRWVLGTLPDERRRHSLFPMDRDQTPTAEALSNTVRKSVARPVRRSIAMTVAAEMKTSALR